MTVCERLEEEEEEEEEEEKRQDMEIWKRVGAWERDKEEQNSSLATLGPNKGDGAKRSEVDTQLRLRGEKDEKHEWRRADLGRPFEARQAG